MKKEEKRQKMIEIFEPYMKGSLVRELIDKCLELDSPDSHLVNDIKKEMYIWYGFDLTDEQVIEFIEDFNEIHKLEAFDTLEREDCAYFLAKKITGMDWPMNSSSTEYKKEFYQKLEENSLKLGYKWAN